MRMFGIVTLGSAGMLFALTATGRGRRGPPIQQLM